MATTTSPQKDFPYERRGAVRVPFRVSVKFMEPFNIEAETVNMSMTGMLLDQLIEAPNGATSELWIALPDGYVITTHVISVRRDEETNGTAVTFEKLAPLDHERLTRAIREEHSKIRNNSLELTARLKALAEAQAS